MDYWRECIEEAFEDAKITASREQIENVVDWVEGAYENYGTATGNEVASINFISDESRELEELKKEQEKEQSWKLATKPCKRCTTTGTIIDGYGRNQTCGYCDGKGRY